MMGKLGSQRGQAEQDADKQPEVSIQDEILIWRQRHKSEGDEEQKSEPKNGKSQREVRCTFQPPHHPPAREQQASRPSQPESGAQDPHFHDQGSKSTLHPHLGGGLFQQAADVLHTQGGSPGPIAVWPEGVFKCQQKVLDGISPRSPSQLGTRTYGRESLRVEVPAGAHGRGEIPDHNGHAQASQQKSSANGFQQTICLPPLPRRAPQETRGDRKSTRLNSSHLVISYAVFCLKKKKKCKTTQ